MRDAWRSPIRAGFVLVPLLIAWQRVADAQPTTGGMRGRVVDKTSANSITKAEIHWIAGNHSVMTDSLGRFSFAMLPAGRVTFIIRAPAYPATQFAVDLRPGEDLERTIVLDSTSAGLGVPTLPAVAVNAASPVVNKRLIDFERRRSTGSGQYLTRADIERSGAYNLQAAVRGLRGVVYECGGGGGCYVRMARAPMQCLPDYVVDERVNNSFGPSTPIRDIEAIEVYTGPSDVAGEFAGATAGCGVIVIWTRSGPPRRP
jgi:hypothetical protein